MLGVVWSLAVDLGIDPDRVLDWRESKAAMWAAVAGDHQRRRLLREMVLTSHAIWDPAKLPEFLDEDTEKRKDDDAARALAVSERVAGMTMGEVTLDELDRRSRKSAPQE